MIILWVGTCLTCRQPEFNTWNSIWSSMNKCALSINKCALKIIYRNLSYFDD